MEMANYGDYAPVIEYFVHRLCTPSWEIAEDTIGFIDLTYVVAGSAFYTIGDSTHRVNAGDLICIPKNTLRSAVPNPDDLMESYPVNLNLYNHLGEEKGLPFPLLCHIGHQPDILAYFRDMNAAWLGRGPGHLMKVRAYMLLILQRYFELVVYHSDSGLIDSRVQKAIRHIADHYAEPLTIQSLADLVGLNAVYFGNLFKESTGTSFRNYLTNIRLNHAEDMLRSGEYNVNETAMLCGYSDIFYFSKVYKDSRGIPPSKVFRSG